MCVQCLIIILHNLTCSYSCSKLFTAVVFDLNSNILWFLQILDHFCVLDLRMIILMLFIPLLLTCYIRNLKLLAPFSQVANVLMFLSLGTLMYFLLPNLPPISSRPLYGTPSGYVFFFSTTLFALSATGVVSTC